ncbi:MAG: Ig-like domain-containing protein [Verrucomicrobiales bacterium]|nr:Ig-like domain-containing protein [Verrucomicrobiales bacterium]
MKTIGIALSVIAAALAVTTARAATNLVVIGNYFFRPTNITIAVGDTVLWSNAVAATTIHDSTSTNAAMLWASGDLTTTRRTFALRFTNAGYFPYICARHVLNGSHPEQTGTVTVVAANLPPSVSLTNPPHLARFRAPADIQLRAVATDPDGSVTNVQFFINSGLLGHATVAPYVFTVSNLAAGNYAFTARAVDNAGAAATSAPVNVSVLTNALLLAPERLPDGAFRFTVSGVASQSYALEFSSNLLHWSALHTNVAPANLFNVTDSTATNVLERFYRMRQNL